MGSASDRECFWKQQTLVKKKTKETHNRKDNIEKKMRLYYR